MTLSEYSVISRAVEHYGVNSQIKMTLTQWFSIPLRFTWALALSGSDAFMKPLPQNMTGLFNITKCRTITHGSAKKN